MIKLTFDLTDNETGATRRVMLTLSGEERVEIAPVDGFWENGKELNLSNAEAGLLKSVRLILPGWPVTGFEKKEVFWELNES